MAKGFKECKICGKMYEYCTTERRDTIFRWQDVACCPEHGAMYFARVADSRGEKLPKSVASLLPVIAPVDEYIDDDFEDEEEEDENED